MAGSRDSTKVDHAAARQAQADTVSVTLLQVFRSDDFKQGVADVRAGRPARFDDFADDWLYERGRMWAFLAPVSMPLRFGRRLNWEAVKILHRALAGGDIL
jgi:hypothetical protein